MVDEKTKKEVKRIFALSRQDIYFMVIILMLGINMAFNFSLIEPVRQIQEAIKDDVAYQTKQAVERLAEFEQNVTITEARREAQFVMAFDAILQDSDEELDKLKQIAVSIANKSNITLSAQTLADDYTFENGTVTYPNGSKLNVIDIFREKQPLLIQDND